MRCNTLQSRRECPEEQWPLDYGGCHSSEMHWVGMWRLAFLFCLFVCLFLVGLDLTDIRGEDGGYIAWTECIQRSFVGHGITANIICGVRDNGGVEATVSVHVFARV